MVIRPFHTYFRWLLTFVVSLLNAGVYAQNLSQPLPIDPNVKISKLSNGLTYYIRKNSRPEKKVELRLVINAGSILEDDDQQGLAHFTEHMAFNGSKNFKKNDLVSYLQSIGVEFGADLNAETSFNETVYILPIPTEKKENVEKGFQILEDWAGGVAFENPEIDKERGIILEEARMGKGADDRIFRKVYPKLFEGSKYADRLPIGKEDILKTFKYDAIKRFYKDWYRPDNMAVFVVGDIEPAEAERLVKLHFEKLKNPANEKVRKAVEVFPRKSSEGLVITDKEATNHVVEIYYSSKPSKPETTLGDYREFLIRRLFTAMLGQRMQELTQQAEPPFVFGGSNIGGWARGYEGFQSYAYISKAGVGPALNALVQEGERARQFGFTTPEMDRTKKMMLKGMERAYNERDKTESAGLVQEYINNFLEQESIPGIENEYNFMKQYVEGITLEEVNRYAAQHIPSGSEKKLVVLTGPETADFTMPSGDQLLAMAESAALAPVKAYEETTLATLLLDKAPTAGTIKSEKENKTLGTTELILSNGVSVTLKPTDFKNDQVILGGTRFGGQSLFDVKERTNAEYASSLVSQMGVGNFSPNDLRKFLAGKSVSAVTRMGQISESVSAQCSATDIETMLQLTFLYFTQPRMDNELFRSFVTKQQAMVQNMMADPESVLQDTLISVLYRKHPWAPRLPRPETFKQIDAKRALDMYKVRFANANGFKFVVVGAFDPAVIKPLLSTYLGSLPSAPITSSFKDVGLRPVTGVVKKEIYKGTENKSLIRLFWNGEAPFSNTEQLRLQAAVEVLNLRIIEKLREELGGIYSGGAYGSLSKLPYPNYSVGISFPCAPENVQKLIAATLAEIENMKTKGPAEADLNKVKETWKQQHLTQMKDNGYWTRQLLQNLESGAESTQLVNYEANVNAITLKDVKEAAAKYFDMKNYVQVVLNPEKGS
jgi:zinc protease